MHVEKTTPELKKNSGVALAKRGLDSLSSGHLDLDLARLGILGLGHHDPQHAV